MIFEILLESVKDTVKMLPFLLLAYFIIEHLEHSQSKNIEKWLAKGGRFGFVPGALLGSLPQCGFSAMAANFYASRVVTLGTLIAVFIATSDEAIPIMLSHPKSYPSLLMLLGMKITYAIIVGFLLDFFLVKLFPASLVGGYKGDPAAVDCHQDDEDDSILLSALKHTANIYLYILVFTFLFGLLVEFAGQQKISSVLNGMGILQPFFAGLVGMIPNCASSVLLTQLYLSSSISFGSLFAGLSANAGVGIIILLKANKSLKQNLFIVGLQYAFGTLPGLILHLAGI